MTAIALRKPGASEQHNREHESSSERFLRCIVLTTAPRLDQNETTDKGYINQLAVLTHRADLVAQGLTVEGVESAREVDRLTRELGLDLPLHAQVHRILFEAAPPRSLLDCLMG